jgi:hypothetical protein
MGMSNLAHLAARPLEGLYLLFLAAGFAALGVACRWPDTRFSTSFAPDFSHARHTVSVFGVFKDGQMSSEAWGALRPRLEPVLGASRSEGACSTALASIDSRLLAAVDDYARENGPTDDLLAQLAPAAQGDLILVLMEAGRLPTPEKVSVVDSPAPRGPGAAGGHGSGGFAVFGSRRHAEHVNRDVLQLSASLFSVAQGQSVALIELQYSGTSFEEAVKAFAARLAQSLPETTCSGWNRNVKLDEERIRSLVGGESAVPKDGT